MYHFIRRFFIFILVLAFGFSFLLCCFVHSVRCQSVWHPVGELDYKKYIIDPTKTLLPTMLPDYASSEGFYSTWGVTADWYKRGSLLGSPTYPFVGQMNTQPFGQWQFSGSASSLFDLGSSSLGTSMLRSNLNLVSPTYGMSVAGGIWGAGGPISGYVNYSLPSSPLSFLQTSPPDFGTPTIYPWFNPWSSHSDGPDGPTIPYCPPGVYCAQGF